MALSSVGLGPGLPLHLDAFLEELVGAPPARADGGDAARHDDHRLDALGQAALHREAARRAAEGRRVAHRGVEKIGQAHVDAEGRRAQSPWPECRGAAAACRSA